MSESDRVAFAEGLSLLAEVFRARVTTDLAEVYFQALTEFELHDVQEAMQRAVRENQWFPKPMELRRTIDTRLERAYQYKIHAWNDVKRAEMGDD
jgi:hypothetical protein